MCLISLIELHTQVVKKKKNEKAESKVENLRKYYLI